MRITSRTRRMKSYLGNLKERESAEQHTVRREATRAQRMAPIVTNLKATPFESLTSKQKAFVLKAAYPQYSEIRLRTLVEMVEQGKFSKHLEGIRSRAKKP